MYGVVGLGLVGVGSGWVRMQGVCRVQCVQEGGYAGKGVCAVWWRVS